MADTTIEFKENPNEATAYAVNTTGKSKVQLVGTPSGDLELSENPNVDTGYLTVEGKKHKVKLVAQVDGDLELPTSATSNYGYATGPDGKKHRVQLTAALFGGGGGGGGGASSDDWQPNPNWWDIKKILDEDTRDYPGKVGVILYNFNDVSSFQLSAGTMTAVATSDGAFYSYANNGANVSHNWDTSKDKDDGHGLKTRWVIYYYTTDVTSDRFLYSDAKFGWAYNFVAYLVLRINCENSSSFCNGQKLLEAIETEGYGISGTAFNGFCYECNCLYKLPDNLDTSKGTSFSSFCYSCSSLQRLPDNLDTSNGTNFSNFCQSCGSLQRLPDNLDTSNGTNFNGFCQSCGSLYKLPDNLDTSKGTSFSGFCQYCYVLYKLPDNLDTSNGTNFNGFCQNANIIQKVLGITMSASTTAITSKYSAPFYGCSWLQTILLTLPSNTNFWLDFSTRISIESFRYIADQAPDVTATPRTLTVGSTNISRINEADPTIITDLNAKGWTVA